MLERLAPTGSGFPTAYAGDLALHSRYNPPAEAERYINSLRFRKGVRFFILLEPGLGYAAAALRKKFPDAAILMLHVSDFLAAQNNYAAECPSWSPGSGTPLLRFLEEHIPDTEASSIALVEWRPSRAAFGAAYLRLLAETAEHIKRADANKRTAANFGRRWFKNALKNLGLLRAAPLLRPFDTPLVVAAAGPSLEEAIPSLAEQKRRSPLFILAVSSSAPALLAADLTPDLVLGTDGGNWALLHLYDAIRRPPPAVFAAALTAALPSQFAALPWLPISDGSLWQNTLLQGLPFAQLPQRGTVTATALDLAFRICRGPIYLTGTDLGRRDIRTHARPYSFDRLLTEGANRLKPAYSQQFFRASSIASSGSHGIYAQWFARQMEAYPDRFFSLGKNSDVFNKRSVEALPRRGAEDETETAASDAAIVSLQDRRLPAEALRALLGALDGKTTGRAIADELGPLLFPGDGSPEPGALKEAILETAEGYIEDGVFRG
jgi:hypothetical protein